MQCAHWRKALALVLLCAAPITAITWTFEEDGKAGAWTARDAEWPADAPLAPLVSAVTDGVWRIRPVATPKAHCPPGVDLISPVLEHQAELFDRVEVRLRVVHTTPVTGLLGFVWRLSSSETGGFAGQFYEPPVVYTTDWQTLSITGLDERSQTDLVTGTATGWAGTVDHVRIRIFLAEVAVSSAADVPSAVEVAQIRLTGVGEQLQGELPPPEAEAMWFGEFLRRAFTQPVRAGVGDSGSHNPGNGALGDLDGDGDTDILAAWYVRSFTSSPSRGGWLWALNSGSGALGGTQTAELPRERLPGNVSGTDLDGDGKMDMVLSYANGYACAAVPFYNEERNGDWLWREGELRQPVELRGQGDMDGDGDDDLWFTGLDPSAVEVLVAGGNATPCWESEAMALQGVDVMQSDCPNGLVRHLGEGLLTGVWIRPPADAWPSYASGPESHHLFRGYRVMYWRERAFVEEPVGLAVNPGYLLYMGDFDTDGDVDAVVAAAREHTDRTWIHGLLVYDCEGASTYAVRPWLPDAFLSRTPMRQELTWTDLNGDGILDVAFCDHNLRAPSLRVCVGQANGDLPVEEGRYRLSGPGAACLAGDMDGDGDPDLVVLEPDVGVEGAIEVFLNRAGDAVTVVAENGESALPAEIGLGAAYPNPFNGTTTIPLWVPSGNGGASVAVYNALGQCVRTLGVEAGAGSVTWDGCDASGHELGSGVYVCRLSCGERTASCRVSKVE